MQETAHLFELAQLHASDEIESLRPLGKRVLKVLTVYPGTTEAYSRWDSIRGPALKVLLPALDNPLERCTASIELIWRLWEYALEKGLDPDVEEDVDPDPLLKYIAKRARQIGGTTALLAECALNRYTMPRSTATAFATSSDVAVAMLGELGQSFTGTVDLGLPTREALAFFFFDRILSKYTFPLYPPYIPTLASLLDNHVDSLESLREKCRDSALEIVSNAPREAQLPDVISASLRKMVEEASEIVNIDRASIRSYFSQLAQDYRVWATVGGLGATVGTLPNPVTAGLAITAFSVLGAQAVKESMRRRKEIAKTPYKFVYYAAKAHEKPWRKH